MYAIYVSYYISKNTIYGRIIAICMYVLCGIDILFLILYERTCQSYTVMSVSIPTPLRRGCDTKHVQAAKYGQMHFS